MSATSLSEQVSREIRRLADRPLPELRLVAHDTARRLLKSDLEPLPAGIAILALLDRGWWFGGRHYHAGCPHHGTPTGKACRRRGILQSTVKEKRMPKTGDKPAPPRPPGPVRTPANPPGGGRPR